MRYVENMIALCQAPLPIPHPRHPLPWFYPNTQVLLELSQKPVMEWETGLPQALTLGTNPGDYPCLLIR